MKKLETILAFGMLIGAIVFNLWLYRLEPTAKIDPNDNSFQFALVDRTNQIWNFASKKCSSNYLTFGICHLSFLVDHWVPNWAEGYNLPFYYSHIPQILIVGSYRLFSSFSQFLISNFQFLIKISNFKFQISLFQYYHLVIYLLLSFFPLSVFLALLVLRLSPITAGIGALLATHLSTDGLYGLDPSSFLWRGYGLSSQLFAMIWLPLAIAYSYRFFSTSFEEGEGKQFLRELAFRYRLLRRHTTETKRHLERSKNNLYDLNEADRPSRKNSFAGSFIFAVFFLVATTAGHLGIGIIAILSLPVLAFAKPLMMLLKSEPLSRVFEATKHEATKLLLLLAMTLFFLSYWIVPILLNNNYHNISFWDPIWKFDSYGWKETLIRLFNGDLFDFGRLPILTVLVFVGFFVSLLHKKRDDSSSPILHNTNPYSPLAFLFPFWLLLYFGRTTWGNLIDLIPGMKEFHLSRFLVGIHMAGIFLIPMGFEIIVLRIMDYVLWLRGKLNISILHNTYPILHFLLTTMLLVIILPPVYRETIKYNELNNTLITKANENFMKAKPDVDELFRTLLPLKGNGRVFAGRGGSWGKDLRVAETPYYMHLSTYGINTVLWLPETWSLNSDTEQYFSEEQAKDYDLYNIRYVVAPVNQKPQPFWKPLRETKSWKLYQVEQQCNNVTMQQCNFGYFTAGVRPAIVAVDKESFINVVHLWIQSDYPKRGLFPELTFDKDYPKNTGLPNFKMVDEANYKIPDLPAGRQVARLHNLFAEPPVYSLATNPTNKIRILSEINDSDMIFTAKVSVPKDCLECIVVLKQTSHPNWQVTIDGKKADRLDVFPFFNAVKIPEGLPAQAGTHEVIFSYKPSIVKTLFFILEFIVLGLIFINNVKQLARFNF